jgi:hypothetical protein
MAREGLLRPLCDPTTGTPGTPSEIRKAHFSPDIICLRGVVLIVLSASAVFTFTAVRFLVNDDINHCGQVSIGVA